MLKNLFLLNDIAKQQGKKYKFKRTIFDSIITKTGKPFIGISGLRGAGKTVLLKQLLDQIPNSFYISLDAFEGDDLFKSIRELNTHHGLDTFLLDEVHYFKNWQKELKKIYDFLDVKIFFSSSVSLSIIESKADLSRRVQIQKVPHLSFREYLNIFEDINPEAISWDEVFDQNFDFRKFMQYEPYFESYLKKSLPVFLDKDVDQNTIENIVYRVLEKDLAFTGKIDGNDILNMKTLIRFLGQSSGEGTSYSSLSKNLQISKTKVISYIEMLEKTFLLNIVNPIGKNVLKEPKILFNFPIRYAFNRLPDDQFLGVLKEEFFVSTLKALNINLNYLKSTRGEKTPDYLIKEGIKDMIIEIGGASKNFRQFKGIDNNYKKIILSYPTKLNSKVNSLPLILIGLI